MAVRFFSCVKKVVILQLHVCVCFEGKSFCGNRNWFWFIMAKGELKLIVKLLLYQHSAQLGRRNFMAVVTKMGFKSAGEVLICYPCLTLNHTNMFI